MLPSLLWSLAIMEIMKKTTLSIQLILKVEDDDIVTCQSFAFKQKDQRLIIKRTNNVSIVLQKIFSLGINQNLFLT